MVSPLNPTSPGIKQGLPELANGRPDKGNADKPQGRVAETAPGRRVVSAEDGIAILRERLEQRLQSFDIKVGRPGVGDFDRRRGGTSAGFPAIAVGRSC